MNTEDHEPAFDGVRAVAVLVVVLFHARIAPLVGGSAGVAVALVVSGYLLTWHLAGRLEADRPIRWRTYLLRRGERILPALLVSVLVATVVLRWVLEPGARELAASGYRAGLLLVGNWQLIADTTGPIGTSVPDGAGQHLWAVGVLAQLTLVWPVLLTVLFRLGRRLPGAPLNTARLGTACLAAASLAAALWLAGDQEARALFGTDTRAHQFLFGALLALAPLRVQRALRRRRVPAALLGLAAVAASVVLVTDLVPVDPVARGAAAAAAAVVVLAAIERSPGLLRRTLAADPLPYLGRLAHAAFLWHWPVIVVIGQVAPDAQPYQVALLTVLVAWGLAALTHELVERPVQDQTGSLLGRSLLTGTAAVLVVFLGLVVVPPALDPDADRPVPAEVAVDPFRPVPPDLVLDADVLSAEVEDTAVDCIDQDPGRCTVVDGEGVHVVLLGDSLATPLIPALEQVAEARGLRFSAVLVPGCPWQEGVYFPNPAAPHPCDTATADVYGRILPALDPDVVVVSSAYVSLTPEVTTFNPGDGLAAELRLQTPVMVDRLADLADHVVLIDPTPVAPFDPLACLAQADWLEDCRFVVPTDRLWLEEAYRDLAEARPEVGVLDIDRLVCPYLPICDPVIGDQVVRRDQLHLTQGFGATLAEPIDEFLDARGAFDPTD